MSDFLSVAACVIVGMLIGVLAMLGRIDFEKDQLRKEAIMRGFAEYVVNEDGKPVWQWKEAK